MPVPQSHGAGAFGNEKAACTPLPLLPLTTFPQMNYKNNSSKWFNKGFTSGLSLELVSDVRFSRRVIRGALTCYRHTDVPQAAGMANVHTLGGRGGRVCHHSSAVGDRVRGTVLSSGSSRRVTAPSLSPDGAAAGAAGHGAG